MYKKSGGSSAMPITLGNIPRENEASETIDRIGRPKWACAAALRYEGTQRTITVQERACAERLLETMQPGKLSIGKQDWLMQACMKPFKIMLMMMIIMMIKVSYHNTRIATSLY